MKGFTFIETIVVISILAVVGTGLAYTIVFFYRTNASVLQESSAITSARRGIENSMRDLREATYGDDGSYPLATVLPNDIVFYADVDKDSSIEKVEYVLEDDVLARYTTEASGNPLSYSGTPSKQIISDHVRNTDFATDVFSYLGNDGSILANPTPVNVYGVNLKIIVNVNPDRAPEEFTLTGSANLRNLRTN